MFFKRVLHPVGQGAFFTEQIYDDSGNIIFNVVYDCGEKSTTKHLDIEIENTLHLNDKPEVIDMMFISHLDEDHINGLDYLVRLGCLTDRSVVILPLHYPLVIKLILEQDAGALMGLYPDSPWDLLRQLFDTGVRILGVDDSEEITESISLDEGLANFKPYSAIRNMQPLQYKDLWFYLPFNIVLDNGLYQKFANALYAAKIDRSKLTDIAYVQQNLDKLIEIYKNLPGNIGGVTAINVNSLNVLSYGARELNCRGLAVNYFCGFTKWYYPFWCEFIDEIFHDSRCSCLYTGDCVMEARFNHCLDIITHILPCIGMLQIPHHGRASCYNKVIALRREIRSGFTNFNSTHKANKFVKQIVHDFMATGRPFFQITEYFHSRMEMYVHL